MAPIEKMRKDEMTTIIKYESDGNIIFRYLLSFKQ